MYLKDNQSSESKPDITSVTVLEITVSAGLCLLYNLAVSEAGLSLQVCGPVDLCFDVTHAPLSAYPWSCLDSCVAPSENTEPPRSGPTPALCGGSHKHHSAGTGPTNHTHGVTRGQGVSQDRAAMCLPLGKFLPLSGLCSGELLAASGPGGLAPV